MEQMNKTKVYLIPNDSLVWYIRSVVGTIIRPKVGEYFVFGNYLLKVVPSKNCEGCYFYPRGYCKFMFLEKGNIHCDYDSKVRFEFQKKIIP